MDYIIVSFLAYLAGTLSMIAYYEYLTYMENTHD
jgi:hypothetical protein